MITFCLVSMTEWLCLALQVTFFSFMLVWFFYILRYFITVQKCICKNYNKCLSYTRNFQYENACVWLTALPDKRRWQLPVTIRSRRRQDGFWTGWSWLTRPGWPAWRKRIPGEAWAVWPSLSALCWSTSETHHMSQSSSNNVDITDSQPR